MNNLTKLTTLLVLPLVAFAAGAAQDVNESLGSAYRVDMVGPELWTGGTHGIGHGGQKGTAETYWRGEVPFELLGKPKPGLSGLLHLVHMVEKGTDVLALSVAEEATGCVRRVEFVPVRNHWTPAHMTTYYRGRPTGISDTEGCHVGATVLKERKAVLDDNTFIAEATLKNTGPVPRIYRVSVGTSCGLPGANGRGAVWKFTTVSMSCPTERTTCAAAGTTKGGAAFVLDVPAHGETAFRYALAFSPVSAADAERRLGAALKAKDPFAENARRFNDWFARNVPRLDTESPEVKRMYFYRWFVVKRATHEARRVIANHEYPRKAVYESPNGAWFNCVIGLPVPVQVQEMSWMRDPGDVRAHVLNWCEDVKGYRGYIQFTGMSVARHLLNHPDAAFAAKVYPAVADFARKTAGGDPGKLPVQCGSWGTGAEYQPAFYQFTEPKWDYRHDAQFGPKKGFAIAQSVRLDTAIYAIGNVLGAARLARIAGKSDEATQLERFAKAQLDIVRTRHWDAKTGLFLDADPETYRLADEAPCYDSFAPYLWGLVSDAEHYRAFDKLVDRDWFWDDFPVTTCAKGCPMFNGANAIVFPPAATPDKPLSKRCCWNGPMWHYANTLIAWAFGEAAFAEPRRRAKWVEFFDAWSESHYAYGDRTVPRAAEHFRPEDGARCGHAWDYFHSAWIDPFIRYRCGIRPEEDGRTLVFDPFASDGFRLSNVPIGGREYVFEQRIAADGCRHLAVGRVDADGKTRVLSSGEGRLQVKLEGAGIEN